MGLPPELCSIRLKILLKLLRDFLQIYPGSLFRGWLPALFTQAGWALPFGAP